MQGVQVFNCINAERDKKLQVVKTLNDLSYLHLAVFFKVASGKAINIWQKYIFIVFLHIFSKNRAQ